MKKLEEKICPYQRQDYLVISGLFGDMEADLPHYDCRQGGEVAMLEPCSLEKSLDCPYARKKELVLI